MTKKIYIILILVLYLLPIFKINAQGSNAGFVSGNIWYSKESLKEGDKVKIYTVLFNPDQREFSGTVIFFDKSVFLGKKTFIVNPKTVKDISINWTVSVGDHTIFAKIENAKFLISADKYEDVYLAGNQSEENKFTIKKKIIPETSSIENVLNMGSESIEDLGKLVEEKTPSVIVKPIITTIDSLEKFRENMGNLSKEKKEIVKKELENIKGKKEVKQENSKLLTPFKYIKFFFLSLASFIFNQKIIFYTLSLIILFFFLRYIWRLIF